MSALFSLPSKQYAVLSHDSLCRLPWREGQDALVPFNYVTKSIGMPQFKSVIGAVGSNNLLGEAFNLIQQSVIGKNIQSIVAFDPEIFKDRLLSKQCFGTLTICGYDDNDEQFKVYAIEVRKNLTSQWMDCAILILPSYVKAVHLIAKLNEAPEEMAGKAIDLIKEVDDGFSVNERAGIGGQVIVNLLEIDKQGEIVIQTFVHHSYPDYETLGQLMVNNSI